MATTMQRQDTIQKSSWKLKAALLAIALLFGLFQIQNQVVHAITLSADVSASPSSGTAPLNDVDLTAQVSGTASGPITYKFDCRGDGSWEKTITTTDTSYTAVDLCDYPNPGTYIAKIEVERGGLAFQGATGILVKSGTSLSVDLSASPPSGKAPLNDVDLTAQVSGTAFGPITYKFDCRGDGSWEKTITTTDTSYTAVDLCDYPAAGQYTAKVLAIRDNLNFQGQVLINVTQEKTGLLKVDKKARNKSDGRVLFQDIVNADPTEIIEFQIKISTAEKKIQKLKVKDVLPAGLIYRGKLKIDGRESSQNILEGIDIGEILPGQPVVITYRAQVAGKENFKLGINKLINTVVVFGVQASASDALQVFVKRGAPTVIPTGFFSIGKAALTATLVTVLIISYIFLFRYYFSTQFLPKSRKNKTERELERMIKKRRAKL